ncbi:MAG: ribose 5-phosphate isomerase B [Parvibaculum sp.]|nr:ribose 5-phosphate isomerase B [Parvibaculum sp.]
MGKESMGRVIAIANDHAGVTLKQALIPVARAAGYEVLNLGTDSNDSVDYPDYGRQVGETVARGAAQYGIAICGSGVGISMAANRVAGARCVLGYSTEVAALGRKHNDANILALGQRLISEADAIEILNTFLTTEFEGGRHEARVEKLG